jgi:putative hydrolase of the HAD superfamily
VTTASPPKAVLWDFGGVISTSPFDAFNVYERANGLSDGFLRGINATNPDTNAWAAFERGEVDLDGFAPLFEAEATAAGGAVDARDVIALLRGDIRPEMVEAVRRCQEKLKTALLTNNFLVADGKVNHGEVLNYFDVVIESSTAGYRKPDPRFYRTACELLDIAPHDAVFLDDLGVNLKPARAMGMRTIKVIEPASALDELESVVGFPLR